jgi:hypothetical protein
MNELNSSTFPEKIGTEEVPNSSSFSRRNAATSFCISPKDGPVVVIAGVVGIDGIVVDFKEFARLRDLIL